MIIFGIKSIDFRKKSCALLINNFREFVISGAIQAFEKYAFLPVIHALFRGEYMVWAQCFTNIF